MAEAIVIQVVWKLASILGGKVADELGKKIEDEFKLVDGVKNDFIKLRRTFESIQAVLVDADEKHLLGDDAAVGVWVEQLKSAAYDVDDVLTEWITAIVRIRIQGKIKEFDDETTSNRSVKQKVRFFISNPFFSVGRAATRRDIALKIKDITATLDGIATDRVRYQLTKIPTGNVRKSPVSESTSRVEISAVRGRSVEKTILTRRLVPKSSSSISSTGSSSKEGGIADLEIIFLWGMGGVGKTTLAQLVFKCDEVVTAGFEKRIWVHVSKTFDGVRVAKAIVQRGGGNSTPDCVDFEGALDDVGKCISGKKFLLVLDDVWSDDASTWESLIITLKTGARGSKILVTTQSEDVAKKVAAYFKTCMGQETGSTFSLFLDRLFDDECWSLFRQIAFSGRSDQDYENLKDVGREISDKCKGLPIAAKLVGGLMLSKGDKSEWEDVLKSKIWGFKTVKESIPIPLLISCNELPSAIKRCLLYCANLPKDYKIEADNLIKIWMAQGYLSSEESVEMEKTGRNYFHCLVTRYFFQEDEDSSTGLRFKMHGMVHDLAQHLQRNECLIMGENSGDQRRMTGLIRHLTFIRNAEIQLPAPPENSEKLHTFWVQSFNDCPQLLTEIDRPPANIFEHLKYLKALDLSRNNLVELPCKVDKLMNLRYLNLSHNPLLELPETVCSLCNLQTLKLVGCLHLRKLPQRMDKLINLRHLEINQTKSLRTLPSGIGKLTCLQTLSKFITSSDGYSEERLLELGDLRGCLMNLLRGCLKILQMLSKFVTSSGGYPEEGSLKLGDLRDLNQLRGCLKIQGLGFAEDLDEVKKAELKNKQNLIDLQVNFHPSAPSEEATAVFEALPLNTNLEALQVKLYGGSQFPNWMISLTSLKKLQLRKCGSCINLPPLGKLPSLETLIIENMERVILIGHEFLGMGESSFSCTAFPQLKKLKFAYLRNWVDWEVISTEGVLEDSNIRIMPCLYYLKVSHCDKLKTLPEPILRLPTLTKLRVHRCPILGQRYEKQKGEDWTKISQIPKVRVM